MLPSLAHRRQFAAVIGLTLIVGTLVWWYLRERVTIGVEGQRWATIARERLYAAPFTPGDAVQVRIADVVPTARGFQYDLRYIAYGPGKHNLGEYLVRAGNVPPDPQPQIN